MLSVILLGVNMLNGTSKKPFVLIVVMLSLVRLNVVMLIVVAPATVGDYLKSLKKPNIQRSKRIKCPR
jgi:hypothetical protein